MIYPENYEFKIGFDKIRQSISNYCLCQLGIDKTENFCFSSDYQWIKNQVCIVNEFKTICQFEDSFPLDNYFDAINALNKIRVEGLFLEVNELFDLKRSLETIRSIVNFFKTDKNADKYPNLSLYSQNVFIYPVVIEKINQVITSAGKIKDNASKELQEIRNRLSVKEKEISKRLQKILKQCMTDGIIDESTTLAIRNGRPVIPVNAGNKRQIRGFVHDESSTGRTVYIEPSEVVELNNELKELENDEKREITKILIVLSTFLRPYIDDLLVSFDYLGFIDFQRAKAMYAIKVNGVLPNLKNEFSLDWKDAVHPLLYISHKSSGKEIVPLNIKLDPAQRILIISGPNAGGKSVCLQTVGLLQYMLQCGLLVPMSENSVAGIFNKLFIDIGDEQSIENDLSTYSSHLNNMKFFLKNADEKSLILIDEFGAGTEPTLGGAIAEAILKKLNEQKSFGVITTHYTNLKLFATSTQGIANGAMLYDTHEMQPLFKLEIGQPGSSFAFEIARKIGLPEEILKEAKNKTGEDHINFDKHLRELIRDKRYWEEKRNTVRLKEKQLEETLLKYNLELDETRKFRKEIINKVKMEADEILSQTNKTIENTIREIRESQAEKEKTKQLRKDLDNLKTDVAGKLAKNDPEIDRRIKNAKKSQKALGIDQQPMDNDLRETSQSIETGDLVKLIGQDTVGEVIDKRDKNYVVAFGNLITTLEEKKLIKIGSNQQKKIQKRFISSSYNADLNKRKLQFKSEIDLRGKRGNEAMDTVVRFIDEAIMVGSQEVRILHGKGNGILRSIIRDYLKTVDLVKSFRDEHIERGGSGITIVEFETV